MSIERKEERDLLEEKKPRKGSLL
jgi:hypothetical protein